MSEAIAQAGPSGSNNRRSRKRRRRAKSYSVGSSSDSDSDTDNEVSPPKAAAGAASSSSSSSSGESSDDDDDDDSDSDSSAAKSKGSANSDSDDSDDSDDSEDTDSSDDSDSTKPPARTTRPGGPATAGTPERPKARYPTLSPSPPPRSLPAFLVKSPNMPNAKEEEERRQKFRDVYMSKLVEGFGSDLEKMRSADPNLNSDRLQRLIDSLESGMDVYNDSQNATEGTDGSARRAVDEVGVIVGQT